MVDEAEIMERIHELVAAEQELRAADAEKGASSDDRARMTRLEETLDQCWDLLRQRRARAESGENPADASVRDVDTVEHYLQ